MRKDRCGHWAKTIAEQEESGLSVPAFCREKGVCAGSFYHWRRRLRTVDERVRFALVETKPARDCAAPLELIFTSGERLRISPGIDAVTLQLVMAALRA
jgi:transposase-like protein